MSDEISRDAMIQTITRTETKVEALTTTVQEMRDDLKTAIQRSESVIELDRRLSKAEKTLEALNKRVLVASGAVSMLLVLIKLIWK